MKMRTQDGREKGIGGGEGRQTKRGVMLAGFETAAPGELLGTEEKKKSQQTREAVNEGVMKPCRWGQVIYNK